MRDISTQIVLPAVHRKKAVVAVVSRYVTEALVAVVREPFMVQVEEEVAGPLDVGIAMLI